MAADEVFVSYKSERRPAAEHFAEVLRYHGFPSWFDYKLVVGKDFRDQLNEKAHAARALVVLWCRRSVKSEWVQIEADIGLKQGTLVPVLIEDCVLPERFRHLQCVDMRRWDANPRSGEALDRLLDAIAAKLGREPVKDDKALRSLEEKWRRFGSPPLSKFTLEDSLEGPSQVPPAKPPVVERHGTSRPGRTPLVAGLLAGVAVAALAVAYFVNPGILNPKIIDPTLAAIAAETDRSRLIDMAKSSGRWDDIAKRLAALGYVCIRRNQAPLSDCQWRKPGDGEPFKECPRCPKMVLVPPDSPKDRSGMIAVSRYELTRSEWNAAILDGFFMQPPPARASINDQDDGRLPQVLSASAAHAFASSLSTRINAPYRLPNDKEWGHFARANRDAIEAQYPTGRDIYPQLANYDSSADLGQSQFWLKRPTLVGRYPPNPWGLHDVGGNVAEWTQTCSLPTAEIPQEKCSFRSRGGAWNTSSSYLRIDAPVSPDVATEQSTLSTGLRLVRDVSE